MNLRGLKSQLLLTKEEKGILLFVLLSFLAGTLIQNFTKKRRGVRNLPNTQTTYSRRESEPSIRFHRGPKKSNQFPININTATADELVLLPGIGPKTAEKIILLRKKKGGFKSLEELLEVKGIGPKKLEKIRDKVVLK